MFRAAFASLSVVNRRRGERGLCVCEERDAAFTADTTVQSTSEPSNQQASPVLNPGSGYWPVGTAISLRS